MMPPKNFTYSNILGILVDFGHRNFFYENISSYVCYDDYGNQMYAVKIHCLTVFEMTGGLQTIKWDENCIIFFFCSVFVDSFTWFYL